jgi:hypothetical protein
MWILLITIIGGGYGLVYVHGLQSAALNDPSHLLALSHLREMAKYLFTYLGLPLSRAPGLALPARILGGVLFTIGLLVVLRDTFTLSPATRLHRLAIGLIMAALAAALLAAVGRVDLETEVQVPVRYAVLVAPLHIALLALVVPFFARWASTLTRQASLLAAVAVFCMAIVAVQFVVGRSATKAADAITATIDQYDAGIRAIGMDKVIFPDLTTADRVMAELRRINGVVR